MPELQVGDRVWVGAGYDMDPTWLAANPEGYKGRVAPSSLAKTNSPLP
jgi:hypothetical protein